MIRICACCLLLVTVAAAASDDGLLLERLLAAQAERQHAIGTLTRRVQPADRSLPANITQGRFALQAPDRYSVFLREAGDDEGGDAFVSDGQTRWEVQREFGTWRPPSVAAPVVADDRDLFRAIVAWMQLDRERLGGDFAFAARVLAAAERLDPRAVSEVVMTAHDDAAAERTGVRRVRIQFDGDDRPVALESLDHAAELDAVVLESVDFTTVPDPAVFTWQTP